MRQKMDYHSSPIIGPLILSLLMPATVQKQCMHGTKLTRCNHHKQHGF